MNSKSSVTVVHLSNAVIILAETSFIVYRVFWMAILVQNLRTAEVSYYCSHIFFSMLEILESLICKFDRVTRFPMHEKSIYILFYIGSYHQNSPCCVFR